MRKWQLGQPIRLTVAIPTVGRTQELWDTLFALAPQLELDEEILVIDQNQPSLNWPMPLRQDKRFVSLHLKQASLTRARNTALNHAKNPFVVFLDDDIIPADDLLMAFRKAAERNPVAVWTGTVTQRDRARAVIGVGEVDLNSGAILTDYTNPPEGPVPFFAGGLCLLPRYRLGKGPWFHPAFRGASQGEEIDFAMRLQKIQVPILCDPSIRMHHLKADSGGCRTRDFQYHFAANEAFNRALFWGRNGHLFGWWRFFKRTKSWMEYHSRNQSRPWPRHSLFKVLKLGKEVAIGLIIGLRDRYQKLSLVPE
jgi:GT2 family glycosyltransferase